MWLKLTNWVEFYESLGYNTSMNKYVLKASKRDLIGSKVKKIRKEGFVPGSVYGKGVDSVSIQFSTVDFNRIYKQSGETNVIWLSVEGEGKERPTLVKNVTVDPMKGQLVHIDLHQVNLKEKVTANVPVEIVGESELVKSGSAILSQNLHEIEVECLPTDIPENYEVDITNLREVGDNLKVSDLKSSSTVEIKLDPEAIIISLSETQKEEEPLDTTVAEAEVAGEEKKAEDAPAEEKSKE